MRRRERKGCPPTQQPRPRTSFPCRGPKKRGNPSDSGLNPHEKHNQSSDFFFMEGKSNHTDFLSFQLQKTHLRNLIQNRNPNECESTVCSLRPFFCMCSVLVSNTEQDPGSLERRRTSFNCTYEARFVEVFLHISSVEKHDIVRSDSLGLFCIHRFCV